MSNRSKSWFKSWFNTPYYHILYKDRDHREAAIFMNNLTRFLNLSKKARILDLACGRGRHAKYLYKKGFDVTGVDISEEAIVYAKDYETEHLHFDIHDMRTPYPQKFDAVLNLFTSFGYFEEEKDNLRTIESIKASLNPSGKGVIDFLNTKKAIANLVPNEAKSVNGINFKIERLVENNFILKHIYFEDEDETFHFTERVMALTLEDFKIYFQKAGLQLDYVFGDYELNPFDEDHSERLILIFSK